MIVVNHLVGLCFFMIVEVSFGYPQTAPAPGRHNVPQPNFPRATEASESSNTQTTFQRGPALAAEPTVVHDFYIVCLLLRSALSFCDSASPGFNTMDFSMQASCLCSNSNFWTPPSFGDATSDCDLYFSTQAPSIISQELTLNDLCFTVVATTSSGVGAISSVASGTSTGSPPSSTQPISASPTITRGPGNTSIGALPGPGPIQNLTPAEKGGISVGCGVAALLVGYGIFVGCRRKRKQEDETVEQVDGSFPSTKEKRSSIKERTPSVSEIPRGQSVEIHDAEFVLPATVTI